MPRSTPVTAAAPFSVSTVPHRIVTAIYGEGKGIGFAIPMDDVMTILSEFTESKLTRPILGLFIGRQKEDKRTTFLSSVSYRGAPQRKRVQCGGQDHGDQQEGDPGILKIQVAIRSVKSRDTFPVRLTRGGKRYTVTIDTADVEEYSPQPVDQILCGMKVSDISGTPG
jgi:S1-C subfamily serine protease